jgi:SAM-dependent methyltransferase
MSSTMEAEEWDRRYATSELVWTAQPNRFLVSELEGVRPTGRALDLACGEGRNAVWLAERGWKAIGVDFSGIALEKAKRLADERGVGVEWVKADLSAYRGVLRCYALVIVFYLQVPAGERSEMLRRAADAVADDGILLVVAHDSSNLSDGYGGPTDPAVLYTAKDVVGDLDRTGLVVERAEVVQRPVETPDGERIALDALVRARRPPR